MVGREAILGDGLHAVDGEVLGLTILQLHGDLVSRTSIAELVEDARNVVAVDVPHDHGRTILAGLRSRFEPRCLLGCVHRGNSHAAVRRDPYGDQGRADPQAREGEVDGWGTRLRRRSVLDGGGCGSRNSGGWLLRRTLAGCVAAAPSQDDEANRKGCDQPPVHESEPSPVSTPLEVFGVIANWRGLTTMTLTGGVTGTLIVEGAGVLVLVTVVVGTVVDGVEVGVEV